MKVSVHTLSMIMGEAELRQALTQLAERLRFAGAPRIGILIGGGAALILLGLRRTPTTTQDIDIVAIIDHSGERPRYHRAEPFPPYLEAAIAQTTFDLGLPPGWINAGPTSLVDFGLPPGCLERAVRTEFGENLTVYFASRLDQIYFKLYAAADQGGGRHLADLLALAPTADELLQAANWSRTHDPSEGYRAVLKRLLSEMGQVDVAGRL